MALVKDPDFNIMQQSHALLAIAKLLVVDIVIVGCIWRKHVLAYASIVFIAGVGEFGELTEVSAIPPYWVVTLEVAS